MYVADLIRFFEILCANNKTLCVINYCKEIVKILCRSIISCLISFSVSCSWLTYSGNSSTEISRLSERTDTLFMVLTNSSGFKSRLKQWTSMFSTNDSIRSSLKPFSSNFL